MMKAAGARHERPLRPVGTSSEDHDRELAEQSGRREDREIVLSVVAGVLLGVPIGVISLTAFVAAILAVHGSLTVGALWAGVWGGLVGGAYFGGAIGLATARPPETGEHLASPETPRPTMFRHAA